ncbi:MAG TPA: DUF1501 domain-containing protein, partial [Pirellulales bacterium]|nr:DUF1501 domain-containing protein [Pirellulales bacterium]
MEFSQMLDRHVTRRTLLGRSARGLGGLALASLINGGLHAETTPLGLATHGALPSLHFAPKAKRVIYLFMSGAPSHIDLFDNKPKLKELTGQELPKSVRGDQRITGMTSGQSKLLMVGPAYDFKRYGQCGAEITEMMPHIGSIADDI